jgi:presenilin 1
VLQRPLPALPFSLLLGVLFFIIGALTFRPFGLNLREDCLVF